VLDTLVIATWISLPVSRPRYKRPLLLRGRSPEVPAVVEARSREPMPLHKAHRLRGESCPLGAVGASLTPIEAHRSAGRANKAGRFRPFFWPDQDVRHRRFLPINIATMTIRRPTAPTAYPTAGGPGMNPAASIANVGSVTERHAHFFATRLCRRPCTDPVQPPGRAVTPRGRLPRPSSTSPRARIATTNRALTTPVRRNALGP